MSGTKALCTVYATLYQKCLQGYKTEHVKTCDDYVFFLKASGCAYHYYDYFQNLLKDHHPNFHKYLKFLMVGT